MKRISMIIIGALMVIGLMGCGSSGENSKKAEQKETNGAMDKNNQPSGIVAGEIQPSLVKQDSQEGQMVYEYNLKNQTEKEHTFTFSSGKKIDFEVKDSTGKVVYRDSDSKMYSQASEKMNLKQAEEFSQKVTLPKLESGSYTLEVWLTAQEDSKYKVKVDVEVE